MCGVGGDGSDVVVVLICGGCVCVGGVSGEGSDVVVVLWCGGCVCVGGVSGDGSDVVVLICGGLFVWVEWVVMAEVSWWCYDVVVVFVWVE